MEKRVRAFRGASTIRSDREDLLRAGACELIQAVLSANDIELDDIVCVFASATPDLASLFVGSAIREECGLEDVPIMGMVEAVVEGSPGLCIRVMVQAYSLRSRRDAKHVYLHGAVALRPDLATDVGEIPGRCSDSPS